MCSLGILLIELAREEAMWMDSDEQIAIERLCKEDISGLEVLVQIYQVRAVRTAYGITHDMQMAEDVVADAFITVYERIKQFNTNKRFEPWFCRIVINNALKKVKKSRRVGTLTVDLFSQVLVKTPTSIPGPEENTLNEEFREFVSAAIKVLPPKQRAVVILRYYLDIEEVEMAHILGCPLGTVKWRLHAARTKLKSLFEKSAVSFEH